MKLMKDGRPSLIFDVRYFLKDRGRYLNDNAITAYGRRLAWFLNGEGLSLGSYHSLYLCFSDALAPESVTVTEEGAEWWQRYTYVGVTKSFPDCKDSLDVAMRGTVSALKVLRPDAKDLIDAADRAVRRCGGHLRFLVRTKPYKKYVLQAATTIGTHPEPSLLYFSILSKAGGEFAELSPIGNGVYFQACSETAGTGLSHITISTSPEGKLRAEWKKGDAVATVDIPTESKIDQALCYSKLVRYQ